MKIALVVTGVSSKASGVSVFVCNLAEELNRQGHDCSVVTCSSAVPDYSQFDVVHINALWSPWLHRQFVLARRAGARIVWSPHGMLTKWAMHNHWWKKIPAWWVYQKRDLMRADLIHVTAEAEIEDVRRVGLANKVVVAPLGVHLDDYRRGDGIQSVRHKDGVKTLSFVGRLHRIKGLDRLLRAFSKVRGTETAACSWKVELTGPDQEGHAAELKALVEELGLTDWVTFAGPRFGQELKSTFSQADCLVLPSYSENFGSVVVESLASGVPAIATKGTPWRELEMCHCGWWVDNSEEGIENALRAVMRLSHSERLVMGENGRKLVESKYTWAASVKTILAAYSQILKEHYV